MSGEAEGGLSVALANWNGMRYVGRCLDAVFAQTLAPTEVVVVDNGSTDGSREWIGAHYPQVRLLENERNEGFAAGYNRAMAACSGTYVLILNTDVFLERDFAEKALAVLHRHGEAGAVTGRVYQEGTGGWINSGFFLRAQIRLLHSENLEEEEEVFGCSGALILFRRRMLEDVEVEGEYFDESYFSYGEDIDLAWRAQLLGWKMRYAPQARAYHIGSGSVEGRLRFVDKPAFLQRHTLKNRYLTIVKNASPGVAAYLLPFFLLGEPLVWLYLLLRRPLRFPYLLMAVVDALALMPLACRRRRWVQQRRRVGPAYIRRFLRAF